MKSNVFGFRSPRRSGFTLIEVMVVAVIMVIIGYSFYSLMHGSARLTKRQQLQNEFMSLRTSLVLALSNPVNCTAAFRTDMTNPGITQFDHAPNTTSENIVQIVNGTGQKLAVEGQLIPNTNVTLLNIVLAASGDSPVPGNFVPPVGAAIPDLTGRGLLRFDFQATIPEDISNLNIAKRSFSPINIKIVTDNAKNILSCQAVESGGEAMPDCGPGMMLAVLPNAAGDQKPQCVAMIDMLHTSTGAACQPGMSIVFRPDPTTGAQTVVCEIPGGFKYLSGNQAPANEAAIFPQNCFQGSKQVGCGFNAKTGARNCFYDTSNGTPKWVRTVGYIDPSTGAAKTSNSECDGVSYVDWPAGTMTTTLSTAPNSATPPFDPGADQEVYSCHIDVPNVVNKWYNCNGNCFQRDSDSKWVLQNGSGKNYGCHDIRYAAPPPDRNTDAVAD